MIIGREIGALLDETMAALSLLDMDRLEELETRALQLPVTGRVWRLDALDELRPKLALLGEVLRATEANLGVLRRLPGNERRPAWARY